MLFSFGCGGKGQLQNENKKKEYIAQKQIENRIDDQGKSWTIQTKAVYTKTKNQFL